MMCNKMVYYFLTLFKNNLCTYNTELSKHLSSSVLASEEKKYQAKWT